jgi:ferric-dicitrate binding protein FerR (iron transport regulator)
MHTKEPKQPADNLISGYLKGELSPDETRELVEWIKLDVANKKYFDECCEIWITARASIKNPAYNVQKGFWIFRKKITPASESQVDSDKARLFRIIARYAAVFIIASFLSGLIFYYLGKTRIPITGQGFSELVVPLGSRARVSLTDGTVVMLNAGSTLKYDYQFGVYERVVQLEGEGYFKVAKDADIPFIVRTPYLNVTVLGTEFNVKAYPVDKTIETTLVNGSLKIEPVTDSKGEVTILTPNQKLTFYKEGSKIIDETAVRDKKTEAVIQPVNVQKPPVISRLVKENVNVEPVVSWKENRWVFEQQSLAQIAIDLERKFDVQINFESDRLKSYRFTGIIIAEPIEQVLEVMSISAPITFKLKGRVVTLSENKNFEELNKALYNRQN